MKKYLAILLSVVLLLTSVLSVSMLTVSAEGEAELTDNVKLAYWEDEFGNEIQLFPGMDIPDNVAWSNWTLTENTTKLPLTSLMKLTMPEGKKTIADEIKLSEVIDPNEYSGMVVYVEIPDFGTVKHTYDMGTPEDPSDDQTYETDQFRFALHYYGYDYLRDVNDEDEDGDTTEYLYNEDGSIKVKEHGYYQYAGADWFIRGVNDSDWRPSGSKTYYGISLPSGWKGYVCIDFNGLKQDNGGVSADSHITTIVPRQLRSTTDVFYGADNSGVYYGYLPEGESLVMSEPMWVIGNYVDSATSKVAALDSFTIGGVEYNLNTGKKVTYPDASTLAGVMHSEYSSVGVHIDTDANSTTNPNGYKAALGTAYGSRNAIASISYLTDSDTCLSNNYRHYSAAESTGNHAAMFKFTEGSTFPDGGYLVYAYLPSVEGNHKIYSERYTYAGAYTNCSQIVGSALTWYTLEKGAKTWTERSTAAGKYSLDFADAVSGVSPAWEGWIYIPRDFWRNTTTSTPVEMLSLNPEVYRKATASQAGVSGIKFSGMTAIKSFDPTKTVVVGDNNKVVDIATGEVFDTNYYAAKEFAGKEELINNGSATVLSLDLLDMKETPFPGATPSVIDGGLLQSGATYVMGSCAISSMPAIALGGTVTETRDQAAQFTFQTSDNAKLMAGDIDGFMLYVKAGNKPLSFGFNAAVMITADEGVTYKVDYSSAYGYYSTLPILAKGATSWTRTTSATPINGVSQIPANFEGYVYIPKFGKMTDDLTKIWRLNIYMAAADDGDENTTDDFDVEFELGPVMTVAKDTWTENYAGIAFVNGSKVAQDMFDGSFTVPNDMNKDMKVNLLDLVKAKGTQASKDFTSFRDDFLNTYFNDAEYSVLSASFSVASLAYLADDASTVLSENPDRGYRSELFVQFMSAPLTLAETSDYSVNIGNANYTVAVEGNAIRGEKGEVDGTVIDTDYNITHYDMTPFGIGSGGAVHTVSVAAARAYAVANGLAYSTEDELVAAAVKLVDNYMQYDFREGMTNIDVAELRRPVYEKEEGYAEMSGAVYGSRYGNYKFASTREYDETTGDLSAIKLLVNHGRRTIFASDTESEWRARWTYMFDQVYKIGANKESSFTDNHGNVTYKNKVTNNIFNAYVQFTEFADADELPAEVLTSLDFFFDFCRERGVKANFRPAYNADYTHNAYLDQNTAEYVKFRELVASQCADEETMIAHIKQIAPVIAENKDVIHKISSGWIGFGGEMAAGYQYPPVSYKNVITAVLENHCIPNGLYFSSRSSDYYNDIINGVEAVAGYNSGNLDLKNGLTADAEWADKYAEWCGFNNDAFFGAQNFSGWGSGAGINQPGLKEWENDTANAAYAPNDGEMYTNGNHVQNITIDSDGVYHWIGNGTAASDNKIPTPIEAIRELAHHRYTGFSQWHGYLDNVNTKGTTTVMELWQDRDAEWVFEGNVDSIADGAPFNAEERAAAITAPITKELLEANGIAYDPAYFKNNDSVSAYEFIRDHLGYRLVAKKVKVNYDPRESDRISVSVDLKNYGFAAAFNMSSSLAILDRNGNVVEEIAAGDPSTWYNLAPDYYTVERTSSAQNDLLTHTVSASFDKLAKSGTYYVGIKLENTMGQTARLANDTEFVNGYNVLGSFNFTKL